MHSEIEKLREEQIKGATTLGSTLRSIELNVTEFCNRKCEFCPRHDPTLYPNGKSRMSLNTIEKIANDLRDINYEGRIGFVGFGEPLAYPELCEAITIFKKTNAKWIEVNTNGDFLSRKVVENLVKAGCTHLSVSMYDFDISDTLMSMSQGLDICVTPRHNYPQKFELQLVNRTAILDDSVVVDPINRQCFVPFYEMFIDWNGDVLVCRNDWGRKGVVGNIMNSSIYDVWFSEQIVNYRKNLSQGKREKCVPCNKCNINGTRFGKESFDLFEEALI